MLLPKLLKRGDKIAFFSPSSPVTVFSPKRFASAKQYLESKGFELVAGELTGKSDGYRSGSIQERAAELNAFHQILCQDLDTHTYTMPAVWTDFRAEWETQDKAKPVYQNEWQFLGSGVVEGRIIGGNLNTMGAIWGSEYMPEIKQSDILLVEDCMLGIETVERSFSLLKACGIFDRVSAIVLGKHELFNDRGTGRTPLDVLLEVLNGQAVPILSGFDCCHTHPMFTLPLGSNCKIDFEQYSISISGDWLNRD